MHVWFYTLSKEVLNSTFTKSPWKWFSNTINSQTAICLDKLNHLGEENSVTLCWILSTIRILRQWVGRWNYKKGTSTQLDGPEAIFGVRIGVWMGIVGKSGGIISWPGKWVWGNLNFWWLPTVRRDFSVGFTGTLKCLE